MEIPMTVLLLITDMSAFLLHQNLSLNIRSSRNPCYYMIIDMISTFKNQVYDKTL